MPPAFDRLGSLEVVVQNLAHGVLHLDALYVIIPRGTLGSRLDGFDGRVHVRHRAKRLSQAIIPTGSQMTTLFFLDIAVVINKRIRHSQLQPLRGQKPFPARFIDRQKLGSRGYSPLLRGVRATIGLEE